MYLSQNSYSQLFSTVFSDTDRRKDECLDQWEGDRINAFMEERMEEMMDELVRWLHGYINSCMDGLERNDLSKLF